MVLELFRINVELKAIIIMDENELNCPYPCRADKASEACAPSNSYVSLLKTRLG